jgi:hypothetical protein
MKAWLQRVRHDLVKRAVWTARDLRDLGQKPEPRDLRALQSGLRELVDPEGRPIDARALWALLEEEAPEEARGAAFESACRALAESIAAADAAVALAAREPARAPEAISAVLQIEASFDALARSMNTQN